MSSQTIRRDDRVGRRCSPAKRVWGETLTEGSNPSLSATPFLKSFYPSLAMISEAQFKAADTVGKPMVLVSRIRA